MRIEFYSKTWALITKKRVDTVHVPRAGELIDARQLLQLPEDEPEYFFVTKVVYEASAEEFLPVVTCRQWLRGNRLEELMERGWLPGWTGDIVHDDA